VSYDAPLFIRSSLTLAEIADLAHRAAFYEFTCELRDGLNVGGGDYYKFCRGRDEIILVCNDLAHGEVFRPERSEYPFYFYSSRLDDESFTQVKVALERAGVVCSILPTD